MKILRSMAVAVTVIASSPAIAAPVHLSCFLTTTSGVKQDWSISLNEEAGTVTYSHPLATATEKATFTPDKVLWSKGDFSIDRSTLEFTRDATFGGLIKSQGADHGQCKISTKKRAI